MKKWWSSLQKVCKQKTEQFNVKSRSLTQNMLTNTKRTVHKMNDKFFQKRVWPFLTPYFIVLVLLVVLPLIILLFYTLVEPTNNSLQFKFNLHNFITFFQDKTFLQSILLSIAYALAAAVIAVVIAIPTAVILSFYKSKWVKQNIWILISLPIWISMILKVIGLQILFDIVAPGLLGTPISIIIGMVYAFLPFVILPIYNSIEKINPNLINASRDLGASRMTTIRKVVLYKAIPGIITGATLLIIQASTSLLIIHYMGNGQINLAVQVIQSYILKSGNFGFGAAIALVLAFFVALIIFANKLLLKWFARKQGSVKTASKGYHYEALS